MPRTSRPELNANEEQVYESIIYGNLIQGILALSHPWFTENVLFTVLTTTNELDYELFQLLYAHRLMTPSLVEELFFIKPHDLLVQSPLATPLIFEKILAKNSTHYAGDHDYSQYKNTALRNPACPFSLYCQYWGETGIYTSSAVICNPQYPEALLRSLYAKGNLFTLNNPTCPQDILRHAFNNKKFGTNNRSVIENPNCPPDIIDEVVKKILSHEEMPGDLMELINKAISHPNCQQAHLKQLWDTTPGLRGLIVTNPRCPQDLLLQGALTGNHGSNQIFNLNDMVTIAKHPQANTKILMVCMQRTNTIIGGRALLNPNAPSWLRSFLRGA